MKFSIFDFRDLSRVDRLKLLAVQEEPSLAPSPSVRPQVDQIPKPQTTPISGLLNVAPHRRTSWILIVYSLLTNLLPPSNHNLDTKQIRAAFAYFQRSCFTQKNCACRPLRQTVQLHPRHPPEASPFSPFSLSQVIDQSRLVAPLPTKTSDCRDHTQCRTLPLHLRHPQNGRVTASSRRKLLPPTSPNSPRQLPNLSSGTSRRVAKWSWSHRAEQQSHSRRTSSASSTTSPQEREEPHLPNTFFPQAMRSSSCPANTRSHPTHDTTATPPTRSSTC